MGVFSFEYLAALTRMLEKTCYRRSLSILATTSSSRSIRKGLVGMDLASRPRLTAQHHAATSAAWLPRPGPSPRVMRHRDLLPNQGSPRAMSGRFLVTRLYVHVAAARGAKDNFRVADDSETIAFDLIRGARLQSGFEGCYILPFKSALPGGLMALRSLSIFLALATATLGVLLLRAQNPQASHSTAASSGRASRLTCRPCRSTKLRCTRAITR